MSKYAIVFTNPATFDWDDTDVMIIQSDTNPLDMDIKVLASALANVDGHEISRESGECSGLTKEEWEVILTEGSWFVRNCDDVDCTIVAQGE